MRRPGFLENLAPPQPLPKDVTILPVPVIHQDETDCLTLFSLWNGDEPLVDPSRRHGFTVVSELSRLGAKRPHTTLVAGMIVVNREHERQNDLLIMKEIKMPKNALGIELALQTPRIQVARLIARRRVTKRLLAMQSLAESPTE